MRIRVLSRDSLWGALVWDLDGLDMYIPGAYAIFGVLSDTDYWKTLGFSECNANGMDDVVVYRYGW